MKPSGTLQHPTLMTETKANVRMDLPSASRLEVEANKLIDSKPPALQFTVHLSYGDEVMPYLSIPGWRVWKGEVIPPSRKVGSNWYPMLTLNTPRTKDIFTIAVQEFKDDYPKVCFPDDPREAK